MSLSRDSRGLQFVSTFNGEHWFLSNFYPAEVNLSVMLFPTVEHAYQAAKTNSIAMRQHIATLPTPGQAKRMGRKVRIRDDWERVKLLIMLNLLRQKFEDNILAIALKGTHPLALVEGNYWGDKFWGVDLEDGVGKNYLGKMLMQVRKEIMGDF